MATEVKIGSVGDTFQFTPAPGEAVFDIESSLGVVGQFVAGVFPKAQVLGADTVAYIPVEPILHPALQPVLVGAGFYEELHLHLLEFSGSESEVARGNLIAKGLSNLADPERQLFTGGCLHVLEVDEDSLGSFGSQIYLAAGVFHRPHERAEHQIKSPGLGQLAVALRAAVGVQLVFPEAVMALAAFNQWIGKILDVAAGFPDARVHQNGRIQSHNIVPLHNDRAPPRFFDVALEFDPQRPIVPGGTQPAVDLAGLEHETPSFGQRQNFIHIGVRQRPRHVAPWYGS